MLVGVIAKKTGDSFSVGSVIIASVNIQICYQHRFPTINQFFI